MREEGALVKAEHCMQEDGNRGEGEPKRHNRGPGTVLSRKISVRVEHLSLHQPLATLAAEDLKGVSKD